MPLEEPRSFKQEGEVDVDPMPTRNVTLPKLAKGFNQLHKCFEETDKKVSKALDIAQKLERDVDFIRKLPRRVLWWFVLTAISAWVGLFVQNIYLHNQTTQQVQQTAAAVTQTVRSRP